MRTDKQEVFVVVRPYCKSDTVAWAWMERPIPALDGRTLVEFANEQGIEALRVHLDRFFFKADSV